MILSKHPKFPILTRVLLPILPLIYTCWNHKDTDFLLEEWSATPFYIGGVLMLIAVYNFFQLKNQCPICKRWKGGIVVNDKILDSNTSEGKHKEYFSANDRLASRDVTNTTTSYKIRRKYICKDCNHEWDYIFTETYFNKKYE
jgi:hypothetical protein